MSIKPASRKEHDQTEPVLHCHIEISLGFSTAVFLFVSFMLFLHFWNVHILFQSALSFSQFQPPLHFESCFSSVFFFFFLVPCEVEGTQNLKERKRHRKRENEAGRMLCILRIQKRKGWKNKECFRNGKLQEGRERDIQRNICIPLVIKVYVTCSVWFRM